jgi:PPK2 family polyphosphate:nucleotide phosphotransferase
MKLKAKHFRVRPGDEVDLAKWPTHVDSPCPTKTEAERLIADHARALSDLQAKLYASRKAAVLVILQGMDAAGKDGVVSHVLSGINPQGCVVTSFKVPSEEELRHDFLWRAVKSLPERGIIGIFNRSYYEEALTVRVHPGDLAAEGLPQLAAKGRQFWRKRYRSILDFEAHLDRNRVKIVKIFLHLSKDEQRRRLLARIDEPSKNWKISAADLAERGYWDAYGRAYEDCLGGAGTRAAPWHIVPADDKQTARVIVSQIILEALESLDLAYPKADAAHLQELEAFRKMLKAETS